MLHFIKYKFLISIRKKEQLFWTLGFPIILATIFYFAFDGLGDIEQFHSIPVGCVEGKEELPFDYFLEELNGKYLEVQVMDEADAVEALKKSEIAGIYYSGDTPSLTVNVGNEKTVLLKTFLDNYNQNASILASIASTNPSDIQALAKQIEIPTNYMIENSFGNSASDLKMPYFLALISMAVMFGWQWGFDIMMAVQANISRIAARKSLGITNKNTMFLGELLVAVAIQFTALGLLVLYISYVLKQPLTIRPFELSILLLLGSLLGICIGLAVGGIGNMKEDTKTAILTGVSLISAFLAGLMDGAFPSLIEEHCPLINRINPATLVVKASYSIGIYQDQATFYTCIGAISLWCIILMGIAVLKMRRAKYDSI